MTVAFDEVVAKIDDAARQVEADRDASPVLVAVVREFQAKLVKAQSQSKDGRRYGADADRQMCASSVSSIAASRTRRVYSTAWS
jgi:hypothetical protein